MIVNQPIFIKKHPSFKPTLPPSLKRNANSISMEQNRYCANKFYSEKRKSTELLDTNKIKSKLEEILKEEQLRKSDNIELDRVKKQKKMKEYFHKTFSKVSRVPKKQIDLSSEKLKMKIIGKEEQEPSRGLKVREMKMRRKGSPFLHYHCDIQETNQRKYQKILALAKTRYSKSFYFKRKHSIAENVPLQPKQTLYNNFQRAQKSSIVLPQKKRKQSIRPYYPNEPIQPWSKDEQFQNNPFIEI